MLATLTAALLFAAPPAAAGDNDAPPAKRELFAGETWYKDQKADEKDFVGTLSKAPERPGGTVGFGRFNAYRLTMNDNGKPAVREVYAGAHPELLAPYVSKKVKLTGKAVDTEVEGKVYAEIWPARLEVVEAPAAPGPAPAAPEALDLLVGNKVYVADGTPEKEYVGVLQKKKGVDVIGYRLLIDAGDAIDRVDVHLFDNNYARLDPYDGLRVKLTGKRVTGMIGGVAADYILPGRLEVLPAVGDKPAVKELKVLARADWKPVEGAAPLALVIRSPKELALAHGEPEDKATTDAVQERDVDLAAKLFKVETIDWKTQMIVAASAGARPTGGFSVEITGLPVRDDLLTVHWVLHSPKPGDFVTQSFTHPAQAVLTERFDGKVVFDASPKPALPGGEK